MKKWFDPSILWLLASFQTVPTNMAQSSILWLHQERPFQSSDVGIQLNNTANSYRNSITDFGDGGGSGSISDPSLISYTINASIATVTTTVAVLPNNHDDYDPNAYYGPVFSKLNFEYRSIHGYLSLVVCVFGIIANVLNIIVLTRRNMESPTNTILTGMAVSDLLVIASYIPYVIHNYIRTEVPPEQMYNYGWAVFTLFHAHNTVLFHTISIWLTVLLAVWRYITVRTPMRTRSMLTIVQARLYIMLVYIMVPVFCIPVFISFTIQPMSWPDQHRNISIYKVDIVQIEGKNHYLLEKITFWVFSVFLKLIPCLLLTCITLALIKILMEARRRKERLLKGNLNQHNARNSNAVGLDKNNSNQILATPTTQPCTTFSSNHLHPNQHQHRHSQPTNSLTPGSGRNLKATNPNNNININTRNSTNTNKRQNSVHLEMETCFECDQSSSSCKSANSSSESTCSTTLNPNSNNDNGPTSLSKLCFHCGNCLQSTKRKLTPTTTAIKTNYPKTSTAAQSTQSKSRTVANNAKQNPKNNKIKLKFRSSGRSLNSCSLSSTTMTTTTTMAGNPTSGTATTTTATTTTGNPSSTSSSSSSGNSERTTKMLIAVLIMFLVCEFPSGILALLSGILGKNFFKNVYNNFGDIMDMLALINSAVNFVLYCLMSQQFRKTFSHLFCIRWTEEISVGQQHNNAVASGAVSMIRRTSGSILGRNRTASIVQQQQPPQQRKLHAHHHQMKQQEEITTTEFIEINEFDFNENESTKNTNNKNDGSNEDSADDGKDLQGKPTASSNNNTSNNNCLTDTGPEMPPSSTMTTIIESPVIKNNDQNDGNIMMVAIKNPGNPTNYHCGPSSTVLAATTTAVTNTNTRTTEIITTVNGDMDGDNDHERMNCSTSV